MTVNAVIELNMPSLVVARDVPCDFVIINKIIQMKKNVGRDSYRI